MMRRLQSNLRVALTHKKSSASVFSFGRDHGMFGRILNQTVIVTQSLAMRGDKEIVGTCFTPQDGNSLLSSIAATLWFMYPDSYEEKLAPVKPYFFSEISRAKTMGEAGIGGAAAGPLFYCAIPWAEMPSKRTPSPGAMPRSRASPPLISSTY